MKLLFSLISITVFSACGNITSSSSLSPEQRIQQKQDALSKVGITFKTDNNVSVCESLYKTVCKNRVAALTSYVNSVLDNFGSEQDLPQSFQQRLTAANACIESITTALNTATDKNCHR